MPTIGVIYAASGVDYVELACASARSLRAVAPGIAIDLYTDQQVPPGLFDMVHPLPHVGARAKLPAMAQTRFDRTLFLDADTLVVGPLGDIWALLDRFDLAAAHDVRRTSALVQAGTEPTPYAFPQLNTGVLLYRRSPAMLAFLAEWDRRFHAGGGDRDQPVFKDLLWSSDIRFYVLPPEFNLRRVTLLDAWEPLDVRPTILHSHRLLDHLPEAYGAGGPRITDPLALVQAERLALAAEWRPEDGDHPIARFAAAQARIAAG